jgi:O-6-methylguanine DNA methyltransferase
MARSLADPLTRSPDFFERVWEVVARIPEGHVTTYGHIAEHLGTKQSARAVGYALHAVASSDEGPLAIPCHRVVNRFGALSGRMHFETPDVMEERLRAEGVAFTDDGCVDLEKHLWIPGDREQEAGDRVD